MCTHLTRAPLAERVRALGVQAATAGRASVLLAEDPDQRCARDQPIGLRGDEMAQPVLYVIDDDAGVTRALRDDLSRRFGQDFRVIGEASATAGLATLRELADEHEPVALLIVDHKTLYLARHARQVTILVRGDSLARSMSDYLVREIEATGNVTVCLHTEVTDGHGTDHLETLTLHDRRHDRTEQVPAAALFVLIGGEPRTQWLPDAIQLQWGYILTGRDVVRDGVHPSRWPLDRAPLPLETSIPGVFDAGDARCRSIKRVASAVGDGATAVRLVQEYLAAEDATNAAEGREMTA